MFYAILAKGGLFKHYKDRPVYIVILAERTIMVDSVYMCKKHIFTKDLNCFRGISMEKDSEVSVIELVNFKYITVCIYRSPDGDFWTF